MLKIVGQKPGKFVELCRLVAIGGEEMVLTSVDKFATLEQENKETRKQSCRSVV